MNIVIRLADGLHEQFADIAHTLAAQLVDLGFRACVDHSPRASSEDTLIQLVARQDRGSVAGTNVLLHGPETLLERTLRALPMDFDSLPLLVEGDSKIIRLWTDKVVVERFKPTVYSYTMNRYGRVDGTDQLRLRFTAALFRAMDQLQPSNGVVPRSAFLAELRSEDTTFLVQRRVENCNLEVRVKRYHIGSPVHRYRYTDQYPSTQSCGPLKRWSQLDQPVVCFDWRHPLVDDAGNRLADEPISDDYAAVWMYNVPHAKEMARETFLWLERLFEAADMRLIDMCMFIDRQGQLIYGEISPDCMRVRLSRNDPSVEEVAAKDVWRSGGSGDMLYQSYLDIYTRLFGSTIEV